MTQAVNGDEGSVLSKKAQEMQDQDALRGV